MSEETGIMIKDRIEYWQNKYFEEKEKNKKLEKQIEAKDHKKTKLKLNLEKYVLKEGEYIFKQNGKWYIHKNNIDIR